MAGSLPPRAREGTRALALLTDEPLARLFVTDRAGRIVRGFLMHWWAWPTLPEWQGHQANCVGTTQRKADLGYTHMALAFAALVIPAKKRQFVNALLTWHTHCKYVYLVGSC